MGAAAEFLPERFRHWNRIAFNFIPHGGGDRHAHHRCPGEDITIALMKVALRFLAKELTYRVPQQNLRISMSRIPTLPHSGFVMEKVRFDAPTNAEKVSSTAQRRHKNALAS